MKELASTSTSPEAITLPEPFAKEEQQRILAELRAVAWAERLRGERDRDAEFEARLEKLEGKETNPQDYLMAQRMEVD
ncbi:unnamed protein product, partial [Amoebophrya sp. A25]|eukprot:GSA25T00005678001.1